MSWWEEHFQETSSDFGEDFFGDDLVVPGSSPDSTPVPTWLAALIAILGVGVLVEFGHAKMREIK